MTNLLFAAVLLIVAGVLMWRHIRHWQSQRRQNHDDETAKFFQHQFQRRLIGSGLMAIIGLAVAGGSWLRPSTAMLVYWSIVLVLVCGLCVIALVDALSTRTFYRQARARNREQRSALEEELRQLRSSRPSSEENGRPGS